MTRAIVLYGVESEYAPEVLETLRRSGIVLAGAVITGALEWDLDGIGATHHGEVPDALRGRACVVPWMTPGWRKQRVDRALDSGLVLAPALLDPTANVPGAFAMGEGSYANAGAGFGTQCRIGRCVVVGRNVTVSHHVTLADFTSISVGATVASRVTLRSGAMVGAGAVVAPGLTIGANAVVGAGASVGRDVPDNTTVLGSPARVVRTGIAGFNDVGV